MDDIPTWKLARRPNYEVNDDLQFPYSELPYLGEYELVKIPLSDPIDHVDYWGEGRIIHQNHETSGYPNCYNVNLPYQLVSNGSDRDRKIPNRIPVASCTNCDTSSYIKDDTVLAVTIMGAHINASCAKDIARIVNSDEGKVIAFGYKNQPEDIVNLTTELNDKGMINWSKWELPSNLTGVSKYKDYMVFANMSKVENSLYNNVINGEYDVAVEESINLFVREQFKHLIKNVVTKLLYNNERNIMPYAYKLWQTGNTGIVIEYFPIKFKVMLNCDPITIVNKEYNQALKMDVNTDIYNDPWVSGDKQDKTSTRVSWKIIPVWDNNNVTFKLYNIDCNMYLKLDDTADGIGDRQAWGSSDSGEVRHRFYLRPLFINNELLFLIINCQYQQALKLAESVDSNGDRLLWGHNGPYNNEERFRWILAAW